jgi:hypothetical protein
MWVQWGHPALGGKNWGNHSVNRHFSLGGEDVLGQGNPLLKNKTKVSQTLFLGRTQEREALSPELAICVLGEQKRRVTSSSHSTWWRQKKRRPPS